MVTLQLRCPKLLAGTLELPDLQQDFFRAFPCSQISGNIIHCIIFLSTAEVSRLEQIRGTVCPGIS